MVLFLFLLILFVKVFGGSSSSGSPDRHFNSLIEAVSAKSSFNTSASNIRSAVLQRTLSVCGARWKHSLADIERRHLSRVEHNEPLQLGVSYRCWETAQREETAADELCGGACASTTSANGLFLTFPLPL